jgi:hypothetical protein
MAKKKKLINILFPKKKIYKSIESSKVKINNYFDNEKVIAINEIEREALKQKLLSVSFDDYIKKKINTKNIMYSIIIIMICMIGALRLLFGAFITDPKIWVLIADPFYLIGDRVLINITLVAYVVASVKARMICNCRK